MSDLVLANRAADWHRLKALVLDSVSSPITRRVYNLGLDEFIEWFGQEPRPGFTKATVNAWRGALEARSLGPVSINVRMTALRKPTVEAADNGLLALELAAVITRVKGARRVGVTLGNWLTGEQSRSVLQAPDAESLKDRRDRAILALLRGCGLRRRETADLNTEDLQGRDHWVIVHLIAKAAHVRVVPVPDWLKATVDARISAAIAAGKLFRCVSKNGSVWGDGIIEKVVWQVVKQAAAAARIAKLSPDIVAAPVPGYVTPQEGNLSRSSSCWDTSR